MLRFNTRRESDNVKSKKKQTIQNGIESFKRDSELIHLRLQNKKLLHMIHLMKKRMDRQKALKQEMKVSLVQNIDDTENGNNVMEITQSTEEEKIIEEQQIENKEEEELKVLSESKEKDLEENQEIHERLLAIW
jgi:hypothetical protein